MRRALKKAAWVIGFAAAGAVTLALILLVTGNSAPGRALIERVTYRLTAGHVRLSGLGGSFPAQLTLARLQLIDARGTWLTAEQIAVHWSPLALLDWRVQVSALKVARLDMERFPLPQRTDGGVSIPHIEVEQFSIDVLQLGAQLAGTPATLRVSGDARLRSLQDASADLVAHRTDGDGDYTLHLRFDPTHMDATLKVHEPASGPLENILQLPGLGALSASLNLNGPRNAERLALELDAGELRVRAQGRVDLAHYSADLEYSLEAPAMSPRAGIGWQRVALHGRLHGAAAAPVGDGHLDIAGLRLAGGIGIASLSADLKASGGSVAAQAVVNGLEIPGAQPMLFAQDPLHLDASVRLNEATRPIVLSVTHRLFSLRAQATSAGEQGASLDLRLPDVAPFAGLAGQDVRGAATIKAQLVRRRTDVGVTIDADLQGAAGTAGAAGAGWLAGLGNRVALQVSAAVSEDAVTVERLRLTGRALTFALSGSAHRSAGGVPASSAGGGSSIENYIDKLQARWNLNIADLGFLSSELSGELQASGRLSGAPNSLAGDADLAGTLSIRGSPPGTVSAELHARGLPSAPSGTAQVHGTLDGAPLKIDAVVDRDARNGVRTIIRKADWKSAHLEAEMSFESAAAIGRGQVRLRLGQLGDLDRILGVHLLGSLEGDASFTPASGRTRARFQLAGRDLVAGPLSGSARLSGEGTADALAVEFGAQVPDLYGAAASVSSSAVLNVEAGELRVASAVAHYRGQELRLLAPARLSYANGLSIDRLKLGAQDAIFEMGGALLPNLDVRASLRQLKPRLVNVFAPDLLAEGAMEGDARLRGTLAAPTGDVRLDATGVRFAGDAAAVLPALDFRASAALASNAAAIDARFSAGSESTLTVSGSAPLNASGTLDLKILGKLAIALINPLLEARGMRAGGQLAVNATVAGSMEAPQILGAITLEKGNLRDYARGMNLSDISAEVAGSEGRLQIKSFKATAASGTVTMTGSIGALQPGIPVDLKIIASNAQPVASNIVTANLNADIHVTGSALGRLDVAGSMRVNRATIGIPDSLPPEVVVLDVRRRGKSTPATPVRQLLVGFDVAIQAPREILVQGRGLDAELGGELHVGGTSDAPLFSGGFDLQRGSFTIAGRKLDFTAGRVSFDGAGLNKNKIDPTLDFTAPITVSNGTATLRITGYADAPKFDFSSTTGLPQDEIMAQLLFGENASQLSALQAAQVGAALATLSGVGSGANPLVKLQKTLGLDRLSVGTGTTTTATGTTVNSGAAVEAGRYIAKRVYVEAKQSSTGSSQVQVDIDLTNHLKLQTRLGNGTAITQGVTPENDPGSSIGLSYQFEY
jgi:translocation and assembly module TamB